MDHAHTPARSHTPYHHPAGAHMAAQAPDAPEVELLRLALAQVDYGMVVLNADTHRLQFANPPGLAALAPPADESGRPRPASGLCLVQGRVSATRPGQAEQLRTTLARTRSGLRGMLTLHGETQTSTVAVLPLPQARSDADRPDGRSASAPATPCYALMVFAKQHLCDDSTVALYARERGLTGAEGQVLALVCKGLRPAQIAERHGVRISTVRTQLRAIRHKTGCATIRDLVQRVSVLPPMARHLAGRRPD